MTPLTCPVCNAPLSRYTGNWSCPAGHSFDIAREGYVNLLVPRRGKPRFSGDDKNMLRARRQFLEQGHYQPLADMVAGMVAAHAPSELRTHPDHCHIMDAGTGEGYYLAHVHATLGRHGITGGHFWGMDVSRDAVRMAAKRHRDMLFYVADIWDRIPMGDASIHVLMNIFSPRNPDEFVRLLPPGGLLITVIPADTHLKELRDELGLLGIGHDKERQVREALSNSFVVKQRELLEFEMELDGSSAAALVSMTPSARHLPQDVIALARETGCRVTASFIVMALIRV